MQKEKNSNARLSFSLSGLMAEAFMRAEKGWIQKHPDADMDSAITEFTEALASFGRGEKWVQAALEDAGFLSPAPGQDMALLSYADQQAAMMQERRTKYSIEVLPDTTEYVVVFENDLLKNVSIADMPGKLQQYLKQKLVGRVIGRKDNRAFFNGKSAGEYTHPSKRYKENEYEAKMRAGTEIEDILDASYFVEHRAPDLERHPEFQGGWDIYKTRLIVKENAYEARISIGIDSQGRRRFYEANVKESADANWALYALSHHPSAISTFNNSVAEKEEKVNQKYSLKESPTAPVEEGLKEDAELYTQMRQSAEGKAALKILQKLYGMATRGDTYLMSGDDEPQKTKSTAFHRALISYFRWNTGLSASVS